jgi:hypothetical protein
MILQIRLESIRIHCAKRKEKKSLRYTRNGQISLELNRNSLLDPWLWAQCVEIDVTRIVFDTKMRKWCIVEEKSRHNLALWPDHMRLQY